MMTDAKRENVQTRTFAFEVEGRASADGRIPVVISSDAVVEVSDGPEVLVHSTDAIDLRRAPLPIIATHRSNQVNVGIVDNLAITGGQLRGEAVFGSRPEAAEYRDDVLNGIIRSVSVGYARMKATLRKDGVLITSRWMPTHTALVAEPADINAGFFRSLDAVPPLEVEVEREQVREVPPTAQPAATKGVTTVTNVETAAAGENAEMKTTTNAPVEFERARKEAIRKLCVANRLDERYESNWIETGADLNRVADDLLKILEERNRVNPESATKLDLSQGDVRRYSLMRALRAATNKNWQAAGLELECNKEISKRLNRIPRSETSFFVPLDVLMKDMPAVRGRRDMLVGGSPATGANLVGTDNQPQNFIELLRNTSVTLNLGVQRLSGLRGNVTIPKMTAGNTAYWLSDETTQINESHPTISQLSLTPHNVAALTELSHQLMQQSTPDAEALVLNSIARDIALAVDVGVIRGSGGSGQPQGIVGTDGVGGFTGTSLGAAGVLDAIGDVGAANALNGSCGFATTHAVAALLMARPELPSTGHERLWKGSMSEGSMFGYRAMTSGQMASATALFGWWESVILAEWGVLELMVNPFSDFTRGLTAVRGWYTCDVGVRYPAAFSYASSIS
jgi:HK97 family phage major capsid protein